MITRVVKMTFKEEYVSDFLQIFGLVKDKIKKQPGCLSLELLKDVNNPKVLFTVSKWESIEDLDVYRNSDLFLTTWAKTKILFSSGAEAWSLTADFMALDDQSFNV
jgi:(4S)-4-hydroxy-5-phosphonooxypentane-2,3-dione isomerase